RTFHETGVQTCALPTSPPPTTPTKANWLPPVNITAESTIACHRSSPEAVASAPKLIPYSPVASPIEKPVRRIVRRDAPGASGRGDGAGTAAVMMLDTLRSPAR